MTEASTYQKVIYWSEEDACYVAYAPALRGCMSHGDTPEEAARNIEEAAEGWLATARDAGLPVPPPES
jgi:predicted RNase H-like HicB family nuclease